MNDYLDRLPPQSPETEACLLGSMFLSPAAAFHAFSALEPGDFYRPRHQQIFQAMREVSSEGAAVDVVVLRDHLQNQNQLQQVGGASFLAEIVDCVPTAANAEHYARIVAEKSVLRKLANAGHAIVSDVYDSKEASEEVAGRALDEVLRATRRKSGTGPKKVGEILADTLASLEKGAHDAGITCSLRAIHYLVPSFKAGQLILIAARPSVGKSALARKLASDFVKEYGAAVFFSLEEDERELSMKLLSAESCKEHKLIAHNRLSHEDWNTVVETANEIYRWPLLIDDQPNVTMLDLHFRCKELVATGHDLKAVFMDYLQLAEVPKGVAESTEREVAWSSRQAKFLARDLKVPLFVLSQLSRRPEQRTDHRPKLSDLRYSGSLEQDADIVLMLYRKEMHRKPDPRGEGMMEILVRKQRSGPTGDAVVRLIKKTMDVSDVSQQERDEYRVWLKEKG